MRCFPLRHYQICKVITAQGSYFQSRVFKTSWHVSYYHLAPNNCNRVKSMLLFFSHFSVVHIHGSVVTHLYIHLNYYIANSCSSGVYFNSSISQGYAHPIQQLGQILYQHPPTGQIISSKESRCTTSIFYLWIKSTLGHQK